MAPSLRRCVVALVVLCAVISSCGVLGVDPVDETGRSLSSHADREQGGSIASAEDEDPLEPAGDEGSSAEDKDELGDGSDATWGSRRRRRTFSDTRRRRTFSDNRRRRTFSDNRRRRTRHPTSHPTRHPTTRHPTSHPTRHPTTRHPTRHPTHADRQPKTVSKKKCGPGEVLVRGRDGVDASECRTIPKLGYDEANPVRVDCHHAIASWDRAKQALPMHDQFVNYGHVKDGDLKEGLEHIKHELTTDPTATCAGRNTEGKACQDNEYATRTWAPTKCVDGKCILNMTRIMFGPDFNLQQCTKYGSVRNVVDVMSIVESSAAANELLEESLLLGNKSIFTNRSAPALNPNATAETLSLKSSDEVKVAGKEENVSIAQRKLLGSRTHEAMAAPRQTTNTKPIVRVAWMTMDQEVTKTVTCRLCTPINLDQNLQIAKTKSRVVKLDENEPASETCRTLLLNPEYQDKKNVATCWTDKTVRCTRTCALAGPPDNLRKEYCGDGLTVRKASAYTCGSFFTETEGKKLLEKGIGAALVSLNMKGIFDDQGYQKNCPGCKETLKARKAYCVEDCDAVLDIWKPLSWSAPGSSSKDPYVQDFRREMVTMAQGATF